MNPENLSRADFEARFASRNVPGSFDTLKGCTVGIAGAGGLGSNVAAALARAGVGHLILADPDRVELSNLNRQLFFCDQVGRLKVDALAESLRRINPYLTLTLHRERIRPSSVMDVFGRADLLVEAFDSAGEKAMIIEAWRAARPDRYIVAASGLAGYGRTECLDVVRTGFLILCGDGESDQSMGLNACRVGIVANMQANVAVELLVGRRE
jgi:sulfur carrier protein ThiS adenylyltransferase